jgi:hypothetical protein
MLTPKHIFNSIEIRFWKIAIPLMSESVPTQRLVNTGYKFLQVYRPLPTALKIMFWAFLGWTFGLVIGMFSNFFI